MEMEQGNMAEWKWNTAKDILELNRGIVYFYGLQNLGLFLIALIAALAFWITYVKAIQPKKSTTCPEAEAEAPPQKLMEDTVEAPLEPTAPPLEQLDMDNDTELQFIPNSYWVE